MSFNKFDIVKFDGNTEPCIVYQVTDPVEQLIYSNHLKRTCPHISIEVMGMIPVELLVAAYNHSENRKAIDVKLKLSGQSN